MFHVKHNIMKGIIKIIISDDIDHITRSISATGTSSDKFINPVFIDTCIDYWNQFNDSSWSIYDPIQKLTFKFVTFLSFCYTFKDRLEEIFSLDSENIPHTDSLNLEFEFDNVKLKFYFKQSN